MNGVPSRAMTKIPVLAAAAALGLTLTGCGGSSASAGAAPKNPENTSSNQLACDSARGHISTISSTFTDLGNGTITKQDASAPMLKAQKGIEGDASFSRTQIQVDLQALADDLGRFRVAMDTGGDGSVETPPLVAAIKTVDTACTSIGH